MRTGQSLALGRRWPPSPGAGAAHGGAEEEIDHQHHHEEDSESDVEVEEPDWAPGQVQSASQSRALSTDSSTNIKKEAISTEESWTRASGSEGAVARERAWGKARVSGLAGHVAGEHSPAAEMMT